MLTVSHLPGETVQKKSLSTMDCGRSQDAFPEILPALVFSTTVILAISFEDTLRVAKRLVVIMTAGLLQKPNRQLQTL